MVPEGRRLFQSLSVEENLMIGAEVKRKGPWNLERIYGLFPALKERRHNGGTELSGGQQQMVAIGRALMANPSLLLCDEISLGLAPVIIKDIYESLPDIRKEGTALVIVEQDIHRALKAAERIYCFQEGRVSLEGSPDDLTLEAITQAYFEFNPMEWINAILQGLMLGGLFALFATGLSLTFGVMRLVNLAHGDLIILASFMAIAIVDATGMHPLLTLIIVIPLMFLVGYCLQIGVLNYTLSKDLMPPLLVTFGLSIILQNILMEIFSADTRRMNADGLETASITLTDGLAIGLFLLGYSS